MSKPPKGMLGDIAAGIGTTVAAEMKLVAAKQPATVEAPVEQLAPPPPVVEAAIQTAEVTTLPTARKRKAKPAASDLDGGSRGTLRDRSKQLSLYLELPVYDQIRELAHSERKKMHQLIVEGIDLLLKKRGSPSISELLRKAG